MSVQEACTGPEMVPGVLRGYRSWELHDDCHLRGSFGTAWPTDSLTATCGKAPHPAPAEGCTCGIYGYYKPGAVTIAPGWMLGVVEASGRVLMGEYGFRAEQSRLVALVCDNPFVAAFYPDVAMFPTVDALLAEYPPDDVSALVGEVPDGPPAVAASFAFRVYFQVDTTAFQDAMQAFGQTVQQLGQAVSSMPLNQWFRLEVTGPWPSGNGGSTTVSRELLPTDPRERALELRRQRNTGPPVGRYRFDGSRR